MHQDSPFHEGERAVQQRAGETAEADRNGRAINAAIMPGALAFIAQQPMAIFASRDGEGAVWASVVIGEPGFIAASGVDEILIDTNRGGSHEADPLWRNVVERPDVGVLMIEPESRRRLRVNGRMEPLGPGWWRLAVLEAYPNCPQYIQRRNQRVGEPREVDAPVTFGDVLTEAHRGWITRADTFYVASAHPSRGADASHRGGLPGFVAVLDDRTLRVPDYKGNSMFNTLGNFEVDPHGGMAFVDFDAARVLQLTGRATVQWDLTDAPEQPTGGTRRYWDFTVERVIDAPIAHPLETEFLEYWDRLPAPSAA